MAAPRPQTLPSTCGHCAWFNNDPAFVEAAFPGLAAMSSGYASVRARDGLCSRHDVYLPAWDACADFKPASAPTGPAPATI